MTEFLRDGNHIPVAGGVSSTDATNTLPLTIDSATGRLLTNSASGTGTVTSVSVTTANGLAGTVATATTTPAITLSTTVTGVLKGNGTAISAAVNSDLPAMSATVGGAVPTPPNNTTTFLRGDGTFAAPAGGGDMVLASAQTNSGIKTFLDTTMKLRNVANTFDGYFVNTNTANRIYTLQNRAGTLSDDTDLALKANLASPTFTGTVVLPDSQALVTPVLGTPTSVTLTNATGLPTAGLVNNAVTNAKAAQMATKTYKGRTSALTGDAEDVAVATLKTDLVLVKGDVGLGNVDNTSNATERAATATLTNKRPQPRTNSTTTAATLAPDLGTANVYYRTTQTETLTISAPIGTPIIGETIAMYVDSVGAQTLTMNATYIAFGAAFPATTTAGKTLMLVAQYSGSNWKTTWSNAV